jgi:hypothetical protein
METQVADIQKGMEVYGTDGERLGTVAEVYFGESTTPQPTGVDTGTDIMTDPVTPDTLAAEARGESWGGRDVPTGFFRMDQGGILGLGAHHLYVPFSAVCDVVPNRCVTLSCSKDDCSSLFANKPEFVGEQ